MKCKDLERVVEYPVRNTNFTKKVTSLCNFDFKFKVKFYDVKTIGQLLLS